MGQSLSQKIDEFIPDQGISIEQCDSKLFGEINKIKFTNQGGSQQNQLSRLFWKDFYYTDLGDFSQSKENFDFVINNFHNNILRCIWYENKQLDLGGGIFCQKIESVSELVEKDIQSDICQRKFGGRNYSEAELVHILKSCVSGLCFLQLNNKIHCGVNSQSIFLTKNGVVKVSEPILHKKNFSNYVQVLGGFKEEGFYISPEQVNKYFGKQFEEVDYWKSDVFCLGLLILEMCFLKKVSDVYDFSNKGAGIKKDLLQEKIFLFQNKYPDPSFSVLNLMLQTDPSQRPNFIELADELGLLQNSFNSSLHKVALNGQKTRSQSQQKNNLNKETLTRNKSALNFVNQTDKENSQNALTRELISSPYEQKFHFANEKYSSNGNKVNSGVHVFREKLDEIQKNSQNTEQENLKKYRSMENIKEKKMSTQEQEKIEQSKDQSSVFINESCMDEKLNQNNCKKAFQNEDQKKIYQQTSNKFHLNLREKSYQQNKLLKQEKRPENLGQVLKQKSFFQADQGENVSETSHETNKLTQLQNQLIQNQQSIQEFERTHSQILNQNQIENFLNQDSEIANVWGNTPSLISRDQSYIKDTNFFANRKLNFDEQLQKIELSPIKQPKKKPALKQIVSETQPEFNFSQNNLEPEKPVSSSKPTINYNPQQLNPFYPVDQTVWQEDENNNTYAENLSVKLQNNQNLSEISNQENQFQIMNQEIKEFFHEALKEKGKEPPKINQKIQLEKIPESRYETTLSQVNQENSPLPQKNQIKKSQTQTTISLNQNDLAHNFQKMKNSKSIQQANQAEKPNIKTLQQNQFSSINSQNTQFSKTNSYQCLKKSIEIDDLIKKVQQNINLSNTSKNKETESNKILRSTTPTQENKNQYPQNSNNNLLKNTPIIPGLNFLSQRNFTENHSIGNNIAQTLAHDSQNMLSFRPKLTYSPSNETETLNSKESGQFGSKKKNSFCKEYVQEVYSDGSRYHGEKYKDTRHGYGKFFYADGGFYEGEWIEDKMSGNGTLYYPTNMKAYEGDWLNDKFNGIGTVYNEIVTRMSYEFDYKDFNKLGEKWFKYTGQFIQDLKQGKGTLYISNGEKFDGLFSNDIIHGIGKYFKNDGKVIHGEWKNNKLIKIICE